MPAEPERPPKPVCAALTTLSAALTSVSCSRSSTTSPNRAVPSGGSIGA